MAIYMLQMWAPFNKSDEIMKIASKLTELPPYIKKWQILIAADGLNGVKAYEIIYVDDNKIAEARLYISKVMSLFSGIKGYSWKMEPVMSMRDNLKLAGMKI